MSRPHETTGVVEKILGNNNYLVQIQVDDHTRSVPCYLSGKMRQFKISILVGDQVRLELPPPFDKGRITFREK